MNISACAHTSSSFQAQVLKLCPVLCNTCNSATLKNACICAGIALDGEGGSDCTSIHDGRRHCYVAAGTCLDGVESVSIAGFHYSYLACQGVQTNPPPTGDKDAESGNSATDTLHKHPGEVVGIVLGVIILCGIMYQIVDQRRAASKSATVSGFGNDMFDSTLTSVDTSTTAAAAGYLAVNA